MLEHMRGLLILLVLLAGCGGADGRATPESTTSVGVEPTTSTAPSYPESDLSRGTLDEIVVDASEKTGVEAASLGVTSIEERQFNDSALGCPEEGVLYAQVITPGYVVTVDVAGETLDYRVESQGEQFRLCE